MKCSTVMALMDEALAFAHYNYPHLWMLTWTGKLLTDIITHIEDTAKNQRMLHWEMCLGNAAGQFAPKAQAICTPQSLWVCATTAVDWGCYFYRQLWLQMQVCILFAAQKALPSAFEYLLQSLFYSLFLLLTQWFKMWNRQTGIVRGAALYDLNTFRNHCTYIVLHDTVWNKLRNKIW